MCCDQNFHTTSKAGSVVDRGQGAALGSFNEEVAETVCNFS